MLGLLKAAAVGAALLSGVSSSWAQAAPGFTLNKMETIFSFGDSYSAIGYDPAESVTELPLLGGTTSGGLNWIHYLALSNPSTSNSFFDFAGFGATVNNSVVEAAADAPPSFVEQVKTWGEYFVKPDGGKTEVEWQGETSLFTIFFGINDIGFTSLQHLNASDIIPRVVESYGNLVGKLHANGARNFLILLMPPTWRSPYIRSFGSEMHTTFVNNIATYTSLLEALAASLPSRYPGLNLVTYNTKPLFHAILDNPTAFGFNAKVADSACVAYWQKWPYTEPEANLEECGAPLKEYVWMDEYHPTWTVHKLLAEGVAEALSDLPRVEGDDSLLAQIAAALSAAEPSPPSSTDFSLPATDGATPPSAPPLLRKRFRAGSPRRGGGPARLSGEGEKHHPAGAHSHVHALAQGGKGKPLSRGKWNRARRVRAQEMRRRWSGM